MEEIDVDNYSGEDDDGEVPDTVGAADRRSASAGRILEVDGNTNDGTVDEEKNDDNNMDNDDKDSEDSNKDEDNDDDEDEEDCWEDIVHEQDILANVRLGTDRFYKSVDGFDVSLLSTTTIALTKTSLP